MQNRNKQRWLHCAGAEAATAAPARLPIGRTCAALIFLTALACLAQDSSPPPGNAFALDKANPQAPVNTPQDANAQILSGASQAKEKNLDNASAERKKQITDDSTKLLSMAIALKAEVDKTTKDTLSLNVIRKADEIEKLAHNVKEKMKQAVGPG